MLTNNKIIDVKTFATRLTKLMEESNETTYTLADKLSLTPATISRYANGLMCPKVPTVISLAQIFDVSDTWLMGYDTPKEKISNIIPLQKVKKIPLLGRIACGTPILAEENISEYLVLPDRVHADFALECKGDSMIDANINDGDIVYIKQQPTVENGEIAAVLINSESNADATLKRFYKNGDTVLLQPENSKYEPFIFTKDQMNQLRILGKVVAVLSFI